MRAFQHRHRYEPDRAPTRAWLLGIATNLVRRHYRSERRRLLAGARASGEVRQPDDTAAVDARVAARAWGPALAAALATIRDVDRDVLLLVAWGELSYAEAAAWIRLLSFDFAFGAGAGMIGWAIVGLRLQGRPAGLNWKRPQEVGASS